ncbi:MAG: EamA family transporter [Tissierellia bacterium]|nr:EamA family transporter [Tissierellia bacterium]
MKRRDILLAILLVIIWGVNFTIIKLGLSGVPSMLLVALRYMLTFFPAIFFIKKPKTELKYIVLYGLFVGVGQFSCVFYAMEIGMPAGIASIVLQIQTFISSIFAMIFLKEKLKSKQVIGFIVAALGLILIASAEGVNMDKAPPLAYLLMIAAPTFWAASNIVARIASDKATAKGEKLDMISMVVWSGLIPPIPMVGLALMLDSPETLLNVMKNLKGISIFAVIYLAFAATLTAYGIWSILIASYPMSTVAPIPLLVPIVALLSARIVLSEQLSTMQWSGFIVVLIGLIVANVDFDMVKDLFKKHSEAQ